MSTFPKEKSASLFRRNFAALVPVAALLLAGVCPAQSKPAAPGPDVLVLSNGDTLHGKLVSEISGKVTFHSDTLGDVTVGWGKIKELHAGENFGVLDQRVKTRGRKRGQQIPVGTLDYQNHEIDVHAANAAEPIVIPEKSAPYIMDSAELDKQMNHEPNFFEGWNGSASAGATIVSATEKQYTFTGTIGLQRTVPTVNWLDPRNKTSIGFNESYGKITQPAYTYLGTAGLVTVPSIITQSAITHFAAERDQYFTSRLYVLGEVSFDHNYSQDLALQQIYGGGLGWTALKSPNQEFDLTGTLQYEKQRFFPGAGMANQNLIGSTFAAEYMLHRKLFTFDQALSYIPAYNHPSAYSATETDSVSFPAYKNFGFTIGTIDSYLNNAPYIGTAASAPTKPNSFQFTTGLNYTVKSKY
jgi:hypothetical protein